MLVHTFRKTIIALFMFQIYFISNCYGTKYISKKSHACKALGCGKKSKILYKPTLECEFTCPSCVLLYLSISFPSHKIKEIKFYITDIIFDYLNSNPEQVEISWKEINKIIHKKMKKDHSILTKRKLNKQNVNLISMVNEILSESFEIKEVNAFTIQECLNCKRCTFDIIQNACCQKNMCLRCLITQNNKCAICKKLKFKTKKEQKEYILCVCQLIFLLSFEVDCGNFETSILKAIEKSDISTKKQSQVDLRSHIELVMEELKIQNDMIWTRIFEPENEVYKQMLLIHSNMASKILYATWILQLSPVFFSTYKAAIFQMLFLGANTYYSLKMKTQFGENILQTEEDKLTSLVKEFVTLIMMWINFIGYFMSVDLYQNNNFIQFFFFVSFYFLFINSLLTKWNLYFLKKFVRKSFHEAKKYEML